MLTESDWATVIANCGMMYGWVVDRQRNRIVRAPKAGNIPRFELNLMGELTHSQHSNLGLSLRMIRYT